MTSTASPMRQVGARLLLVFAIGGLWTIGYVVVPFLAEELAAQRLIALQKVFMLLALLCFGVALLTRAYALAWRPWQDTVSQIGGSAFILGLAYIVIPAEQGISAFLYALVSLLCVAWVAFDRPVSTPAD